jgi:polyphosphate kinase 2 (PPK2 family)
LGTEDPITFVFEGWHASGMGEDVNCFILPLDPKLYDFHTMTFDCYEDTLKPFLLHFWTLISVRGKIAIFDRVGTPENHKTFQEDKIQRRTREML